MRIGMLSAEKDLVSGWGWAEKQRWAGHNQWPSAPAASAGAFRAGCRQEARTSREQRGCVDPGPISPTNQRTAGYSR